MKKIAIIFNHSPHGTAYGREALDAALALSALHELSLFFLHEGIFHLLPNQQPEHILARDYISTLSMLELYDIEKIYVCSDDLTSFQLQDYKLNLNVQSVDRKTIKHYLDQQDVILNF
ncbi:sulfurtransferase complex subunit TusC [Orbaceae bacterium ac157xtp]